MPRDTEIQEAYRGFVPPAWVRPTVERVLRGVSDDYLAGLRTIVLTAGSDLNHDRRRATTLSRGKKVKIRKARGVYHEKRHGQPAWIELFVDNICACYGRKIPFAFFRDVVIGGTLLHEVGHHVHATQAPQHRERGDVAEEWTGKLLIPYLMRSYWYFFPAFFWGYRLWKSVGRLLGLKRRTHRRH